jgi:hypothetical protein
MSDDLDLRGIDQRHEPDPVFRAALEHRIAAIVAGSDPGSVTKPRDVATIDLEPTRTKAGPRRRGRRVTHVVLAIAVAAAVVTTMVVISRDHATAPADTPIPSPLEEPSPDEVADARSLGDYVPGIGPTEVTATRSYVSLRSGPQGWAYVTGSADSPAVHFGLLGEADELVLSALDDRIFVASPASSSQDSPSALPAWLIDSVTGQRGALRWVNQPTVMDSAEQVLALPALHPVRLGQRFLPRVVDRRDWTIRPLSVPADAMRAVEIHQPGSGRIWIGTAPNDGDVGLAYTDDGGASWTDVELPGPLRRPSELIPENRVVVAATGDNVAVAPRFNPMVDQRLFVSADAGETWDVVPVDTGGNGQLLFVMDERLVFAVGDDFAFGDLFVSNSDSDWSRLQRVEDPPDSAYPATGINFNKGFSVGQRGVASLYRSDEQPIFSTDLSDWWSIPSLRDVSRGPDE